MSKQALDELGLAITNAGYTWTPEMRSAYEKGIRESQWVGLTDEEISQAVGCSSLTETYLSYFRKVIAKLKEKNNG